ncbi:MAG: mannosyltransferase family protein [Patescibacteria group bacterium]
MSFLLILLFFLIWRGFDFLIIFFSQKIIPYLGFFPYRDQLPGFHLPSWISALANFDGLHYVLIAKDGYSQYEQAFFPLYPLLIKFLAPLFSNNQLFTGLIISNVSFFLGLILFYKYLYLIRATKMVAPTTILFLLAFPTSFFFGAVYTEGLFFLLVISTLYFLKKEKYLLVVIFAFLTATTRIVGVFIIVPIAIHLYGKYQKLKNNNKNRATKMVAPTLLAPLFGLGLYCFYLFKTTGDPFFFFSSQPAFGASRSTHLISFFQVYWRYFKIFFTATRNFQYFISIIEFSFFSFVLIILILDLFKNYKLKIRNYDLLGLNLFSLINLILPTLTGTFLSIPRFSLMSLSVFIYLSQIKNNLVKYLILIIFLILHILLLGYFTQGYFIS